MHFERYFEKKKINQVILNRKINWFFDIKSILYKNYKQSQIQKFAKQIVVNSFNLSNDFENIKKKKIYLKKINYQKIKKKSGGSEITEIINLIKKENLLDYFDHFIVQGSIASYDFIKNWSDFDTLVVIKDDVLKDKKKLVRLRIKLKKIYKKIVKFSKFQHHGLIIYTNLDLKNYLSGYLPPEALKFNFTLINKKFIEFKIPKKKILNISKKILKEKKTFYEAVLKNKVYNHHVLGKKTPKIPFKINDPYMFELFYNFGSILNIPILFLDAIGKSSHKKNSFNKFYSLIRDKFVIDFIKQHENIRKNWKIYKFKKFNIPKKLLDNLGENYFNNCLIVFKIICKKLS